MIDDPQAQETRAELAEATARGTARIRAGSPPRL